MNSGAQLIVPQFDTGTERLFVGDGNDYHDLLNPEECQDVRDFLQGAACPVEEITFIQNPDPQTEIGALYWDAEYKTLALNTGVPGVTLQIGQENYILCLNNTGVTLNAGTVVYISGSGGEHPNIAKAIASDYDQAHSTIGMLTNSPLDGEHCMVTVAGLVHSLDTSTAAVGTAVYLSATTSGAFTTTKPTTANTTVRIGWVVKQHATDGEIFVSPQIEMSSAGYYLDAQTRTSSVAIPSTPTTFVWVTPVSDSFNSYNETTGVITTPFSGQYTFLFSYNCLTTGGIKQLYSAAQIWNGSAWVVSEYSTRQAAVRLDDKNQILFTSTNFFAAGTQIRFVTWGSAAGINITTDNILAGYTVPAARLLVTGVKTI